MVNRIHAFMLPALSLWLAGCSTEPQPEAIHPGEDSCSHCRMAIVEPQFASQLHLPSGEVLKFDDLMCLAMAARQNPPRAIFVQDYNTRTWVRQAQAVIVKESRLQTPMGSGSVAFGANDAAVKFQAEYGGQIISLAEFLQP